ncbi:MAG: rhodanese-like domain-containing protein, partial [Psychroflexus salarius]
ERGQQPLNADAFEAAANETKALILDTREAEVFKEGFIPNSINIGLDNNFAQWVGELIPDIKQPILLVTEPGKEEESIIRLARVGYDYSIGYLKGGIDTWKNAQKELDQVKRIDVNSLEDFLADDGTKIIDVRKRSEYDSQHVVGAENIPLNEINKHLAELPDTKFAIHCQGGYRSMIAASILKQRGFDNFVDVRGGFDKILEDDIEVTDYVCPSTLL